MTSLSQQLSDLIDPSPTLIDPEDDIHADTSASKVLVSETRDENEDIQEISALRRQKSQNLLDNNKRYSGIKVNRTALDVSNDSNSEVSDQQLSDEENEVSTDDEDDGTDETDEEGIEFYSDNMRAPTASAEEFNSESDLSDNSSDDNEIQRITNDSNDEYINQFSNIDVSDQISKGKALKNQLIIWDNLLELRIKVQKILMDGNKFPSFDYINPMKQTEDNQLNASLKESSKAMKRLIDVLLEIDSTLESQNKMLINESDSELIQNESHLSEDQTLSMNEWSERKSGLKRKVSDSSHYSQLLWKRHKNLISIRNDVIDKWYEKTRFTNTAFKQSLSGLEQSSTQQINRILSDMERLISRTQTKRSLYSIIGKTDINDKNIETNESNDEKINKDLDPEIFDDDDFYHQLLRELIESKTSNESNDPMVLSGKWIQIQKLRNKMKRKVDTKASKGRKIRYDVHQKLINFMAPIDNSNYTEDAKTQLFCSLFGQKPQ